MDLNWYQSLLYGFFGGLTEVLPVSARAHSIIMLKIFGAGKTEQIQMLLIHAALLFAIYFCSQKHIVRVSRARKLARIPKKRRKRPLDTKSLMDFRLWRTIIIPVILGHFLYNKVAFLESKLVFVALFMFVNGVILYVPQFLPSGNKDSRTLSRVDGLLIGFGGALSVLPGISGIGSAVSISSVCGADRKFALDITIMMSAVISICLIVLDIMAIFSAGIGTITFSVLLSYILSAIAAFAGAVIGIKIMRSLAASAGYYMFSYYCWGLALFTFILNLIA